MARNDRDYWGAERGPEAPQPLPPAAAALPSQTTVRPRRISARDLERLQGRSYETNRTIEELLAEEQAAGGAS